MNARTDSAISHARVCFRSPPVRRPLALRRPAAPASRWCSSTARCATTATGTARRRPVAAISSAFRSASAITGQGRLQSPAGRIQLAHARRGARRIHRRDEHRAGSPGGPLARRLRRLPPGARLSASGENADAGRSGRPLQIRGRRKSRWRRRRSPCAPGCGLIGKRRDRRRPGTVRRLRQHAGRLAQEPAGFRTMATDNAATLPKQFRDPLPAYTQAAAAGVQCRTLLIAGRKEPAHVSRQRRPACGVDPAMRQQKQVQGRLARHERHAPAEFNRLLAAFVHGWQA
jgi:hypothetical protein